MSAMNQPAVTKWSDVVMAAVEVDGIPPETVWVEGLERAGSEAGVEDSGGEWSTRCPNPDHNGGGATGSGDGKASLRWTIHQDGSIGFHCHAGCEGSAIMKAVGLKWTQLRWGRTRYLYRDSDRRLMAAHTKTASKSFGWLHPDETERTGWAAGRGDDWVPRLWLWPDLVEWVDKDGNQQLRVVLCEGEKDVQNVAQALERIGWGGDGYENLVTSNSDGAESWGSGLTEDLLKLLTARSGKGTGPIGQLLILCDSDVAGVKRAKKILSQVDALCEIAGVRLEKKALGWLQVGTVKDASDAIREWGRTWLDHAVEVADADEYGFVSVDTGWMYETPKVDQFGVEVGGTALGRVVGVGGKAMRTEIVSNGPVRVTGTLVDGDGGEVGWEIDCGGRSLLVRLVDVSSGSAFSSWVGKNGVFVVPTRGMLESFRAYLSFHGRRAARIRLYDHEGWVDSERFVSGGKLLIGPRNEEARCHAVAKMWHYGVNGSEGELGAALRMVEILSFRDVDESGPVLGWLAGVAVLPKTLDAVSTGAAPSLQAPGTSGHGKTTWLRLATRLFGYKAAGIGSTTVAGLVRMLASSAAPLWIDDANLSEQCQDLLRGSLTGGGRTRGNIDGELGVTKDKAVAAVLYSAEAGFRLNEKAMRERTAVVRFDKGVQDRMSQREGVNRAQWEDMLEYGNSSEESARLLTDYAGTVVLGLWDVVQDNDRWAEMRLETERNGLREAGAYRFCLFGARVLDKWLRKVAEDHTEESAKLIEGASNLMDGVTRWATGRIARAELAAASGEAHYLVTEMLPRALAQADDGGSKGMSGLRLSRGHIGYIGDAMNKRTVAGAIREAWKRGQIGGGAGLAGGNHGKGYDRSAEAVVLLLDENRAGEGVGEEEEDDDSSDVRAIVVSPELLYRWATSSNGRNAGIKDDQRYTALDAIAKQLTEVADSEIGKLRTRIGSSGGMYGYWTITNPAVIRAVLTGASEE